jgi:hypothetical protein
MNAGQPPLSNARRAFRRWVTRGILLGTGLAAGAALGYFIGVTRHEPDASLGVNQKVPLEAYFSEQSFSEIENTKARLKALGLEFISDVRSRHDQAGAGTTSGPFRRNPAYALDPAGAIEELEWGLEQFRGTEQEMYLTQELLCVLKKQKLEDRWLDVYLTALYSHPADPLIARFTKDAKLMSQARQRQPELTAAFELLDRIRAERPRASASLATLDGLDVSGFAEALPSPDGLNGNRLHGLP